MKTGKKWLPCTSGCLVNFLRGGGRATHQKRPLTAPRYVCFQHGLGGSSLWQGTTHVRRSVPCTWIDASCPESLGNYLLNESSIKGQRLSLIPALAPVTSSHLLQSSCEMSLLQVPVQVLSKQVPPPSPSPHTPPASLLFAYSRPFKEMKLCGLTPQGLPEDMLFL